MEENCCVDEKLNRDRQFAPSNNSKRSGHPVEATTLEITDNDSDRRSKLQELELHPAHLSERVHNIWINI